MRVTKELMIKHGVCDQGIIDADAVGDFYPDFENMVDGGNSHKELYNYYRKYFIQNMSNLDRERWLENGKWFQMLGSNPQAIIDGGDAVIGEKYRATSFNYTEEFDTLEQARAGLNQRYNEIQQNVMTVNKCFYWADVSHGKQTKNINDVSELVEGVTYHVFNSEIGVYEEASSISDVTDLLTTEQSKNLRLMEQNSVIEYSVRDAVDGYLCWVAEEQYAFT